jgi:EAL domain-containing protein (putative c-di-GMP-specific phosphodiesterase class I)/CheY-like chemotaxis protein
VGAIDALNAHANRLLILDEDPFVPRWVRNVAEHEGYDVEICTDWQTVRTICRTSRPTLILMDLTIGGGYEGLEALRLLAGERCTTPVVLTGSAGPGVLQTASHFGMTLDLSMAGILPKPIELGQLRRTLTTHLHAHQPSSRVDRMLNESPATPADEARLREAFEAGELRVYYQPQISLRTGAVAAIEALVRWQHPLRGLISPHSFLQLAERAGLIRAITFFVLRSALDPTFPDDIEAQVENAGMGPSSLTLEIDESAAIGHVRDLVDALTRLRLNGYRLSLDNFGTGFSSLVELRNLPLSQLKIDKAYVLEARSRHSARGIVEAVIEFGHRIGFEIVGEGVEDRESLGFLKEAGCDLAQGFLISRPLDAATLTSLLTTPLSGPPAHAHDSRAH